ncbi:unnamed protein product [Protopolystoma xenopodis]|uniref:Uncharacterized protein n=1 Tax=Protopolystoma xenopodis TaxID=117903 RepID=A0A448XAD0_9PLAT|nr:unnamed protein product [Protopolystoma xenopodis]
MLARVSRLSEPTFLPFFTHRPGPRLPNCPSYSSAHYFSKFHDFRHSRAKTTQHACLSRSQSVRQYSSSSSLRSSHLPSAARLGCGFDAHRLDCEPGLWSRHVSARLLHRALHLVSDQIPKSNFLPSDSSSSKSHAKFRVGADKSSRVKCVWLRTRQELVSLYSHS